MPKYLIEATHTHEGVEGVRTKGGSSRRDTVAHTAKSLGGQLDAFYFAFGEHDAVVIVDLPDNEVRLRSRCPSTRPEARPPGRPFCLPPSRSTTLRSARSRRSTTAHREPDLSGASLGGDLRNGCAMRLRAGPSALSGLPVRVQEEQRWRRCSFTPDTSSPAPSLSATVALSLSNAARVLATSRCGGAAPRSIARKPPGLLLCVYAVREFARVAPPSADRDRQPS